MSKTKKINSALSENSPDHSTEVKRLNRIMGQLDGIKRMIEEQRYCTDILVQTKAVSAALKSLESSILARHMNHCVSAAFESKNKIETQKKIDELMDLFTKRMS